MEDKVAVRCLKRDKKLVESVLSEARREFIKQCKIVLEKD